MSGKLIRNLKRKHEETESSSNSSKNSSPCRSPSTTISQASVIVNPSYSSTSSSLASTPSSFLCNGNSINAQSISSAFLEYNKPGTSSSSSSSSSLVTLSAAATTQSSSESIITDQIKNIAQDAKREKHDFYVDTPESSNDGADGILPPTPPSESDDLQNQQLQGAQILPSETRNTFLVEALKRIVELQHELEVLDEQQSEEEDHEVSNIIGQQEDDRHQHQEDDNQQQNFGAEALGFAMCARETLLFLQREGIPENSEIYRTLREKLVGKSPQGIPI